MPGSLIQEIRQSVRALARRPALTVAALLTLALGIGANGAVFSVLNSIVLRPLPYAKPERLVTIWPNHFVAHREVDFMRRNLRSIQDVVIQGPGWLMSLTGIVEPVEVDGAGVSANLFTALGVAPLLGRTFRAEADLPGGPREVVLSHELWRSAFGGERNIVGRSITLNSQAWFVIGVMPRDFQILDESDLWFPLPMDPAAQWWAGATSLAFGRLTPGATVAQADAEFKALAVRMAAQFNQPPESARDAAVSGFKEQIIGPVRTMLIVLFAAVLFILAIAGANVMNLLLVRASERRTEFAVRSSLGATRLDLVRQLGLESLLLALGGGALGLLIAVLGVRGLRGLLPEETPRLQEIGVDWRVVSFCAALALLVGAVAGLLPVLLTSQRWFSQYLRAGRTVTAGNNRTRAALIVTEVALAVVLVSGATLMLRTVAQLQQIDPGFRTSHVLTMRVQPAHVRGSDALRAYWRDVLPRLAALPDVQAVGTVLHLPMSGRKWNTNVELEGETLAPGATPHRTAWQTVGGDYFQAMGIALLNGRVFSAADRENAPRVVIVNAELARKLWPGRSAVGQRLRSSRVTNQEWATVVGVVRSVRHDSLSTAAGPELYTPFAQNTVSSTSVVLRTGGDPRALAGAVRNTIWSVSREVPISNLRAIDEVLSDSITRRRVVLVLLGSFAAVGVLLGLVGIYGLVAHTVRQRTREIGIRMALGAAPRSVLNLMIRVGLQWAALGVLLGSSAAYGLAGFMKSLIFGVAPHDTISLSAAPALLLIVATLAALLPARRAAGLNPASVLQE